MLTASGAMFHIDGLESYYLKPGCLFITLVPTAISTVLGSCVAVCLFSDDFRCGGMNHFVFPEWKDGKKRTTNYGDLNLKECIRSFAEFGYAPQVLFARIIGGAWIKDNNSSRIIAEENVRIAEHFCKDRGIRVISKETGGNSGRRVLFRTDSGEASVERIAEVDPDIYRTAENGGNG